MLQSLGQDVLFRDALSQGAATYSAVPDGYRRALSEVLIVLSHWRRLLRQREQELSTSTTQAQETGIRELEELAEEQIRRDWSRVHFVANSEAAAAYQSREAFLASKRLTELLVTPILMGAPIWRRGYEKPRGYPGDFELMNFMYDDARLGASTFDRVMHQLGREERLAATVRNRKDYLIGHIRETARTTSGRGDPTHVMNIGVGPARELEEFLSKEDLHGPLTISIVDQDESALAFAQEKIRRASLRHRDRVSLRCRHVSFKQLLTHPELIKEVRGQDLIYSAGLFDYLSEGVAQTLVANLVELLKQDGRLLIGNAADDDAVKWVPEFVLDWRLIYRTPDDMLRLAANVSEVSKLEVQHDSSRAWNFLVVRSR
jgi:SAM-dependent methyltransferase